MKRFQSVGLWSDRFVLCFYFCNVVVISPPPDGSRGLLMAKLEDSSQVKRRKGEHFHSVHEICIYPDPV